MPSTSLLMLSPSRNLPWCRSRSRVSAATASHGAGLPCRCRVARQFEECCFVATHCPDPHLLHTSRPAAASTRATLWPRSAAARRRPPSGPCRTTGWSQATWWSRGRTGAKAVPPAGPRQSGGVAPKRRPYPFKRHRVEQCCHGVPVLRNGTAARVSIVLVPMLSFRGIWDG